MAYRKLSPTELVARGLSRTSERYIDLTTNEVISKRQYQNLQRGVTYTKFRREVLAGTRQHSPAAPKAAVKAARKRKSTKRQESYRTDDITEVVRFAHRFSRPVIVIGLIEAAENSRYGKTKWVSLNGWTRGRDIDIEELEETISQLADDGAEVKSFDLRINYKW